jgi:hypothetical protein
MLESRDVASIEAAITVALQVASGSTSAEELLALLLGAGIRRDSSTDERTSSSNSNN